MTEDVPSVPGIGIGGQVMCPYFRGPCLKGGCELWVELYYGENKVGRCSHAYQPIVIAELRQELLKARKVQDAEVSEEGKSTS